MGRIDEALLQSNVDAGQGMGAQATVEPAPWLFERQPGLDQDQATALVEKATSIGLPTDHLSAPAEHPEPRSGRVSERGEQWIPGADAEARQRLIASRTAPPLLVEQFRTLAATLHQAQREQPLKSVIVTSPSRGDGKTNVAVNLALTLGDSYRRRVLLIDADLRRPSLHLLFGVPNQRGLNEALKAGSDEKVATLQIRDTLTLLPAGRPDPSPLGGLSSDRMKRIIEDATSKFDWVIVDSPPVGVLADARLVTHVVDGAVLVVRAGVTRYEDVEAVIDTMGRERILGVVLNAVNPAEIRGKDYYQRYYGSSE